MGNQHSALYELVRKGRRRHAVHFLVDALSFATVIALAGAILILLVGAQILSWYWIVLIFAAGFAAAAYRSRGKLVSPYQIAQSIDRRLDLNDALSTAYYFSEHRERAPSVNTAEQQRQTAEELARSADVQRGIPFLVPRTAYINLALALAAFGMFGLRYGIHRSLDFRSPLVHINFEGLFGAPPQVAERHGKLPGQGDGNRDPGAPDANDAKADQPDLATDAPQQSPQSPNPNDASTSPGGADKPDTKSGDQMPPGNNPLDTGDSDKSLPNQANANSSSPSDSKTGQQNGSKEAKDSKDAKQGGASNDNASLASKLRDALSNLLAKMKPQPKLGGGKPNDASQSSSANPSQQGEKQEGDAKSPGQEQADASANSQAEGEQQQGGTQQAQQGKSEGHSNSQPNSPDGKSGIGKQDGDKAAREAAELAAMGKLSEIIGKRAQNISGEVMVEVSPGKQQLKTQYSQQNAIHSDTGGEINRDEVPLAYQQYVEQYFAQIRKMPAARSKAQSPASPQDAKPKQAPSSTP